MQELLWVSVGSSFFDGLDLGVKLARDLTRPGPPISVAEEGKSPWYVQGNLGW